MNAIASIESQLRIAMGTVDPHQALRAPKITPRRAVMAAVLRLHPDLCKEDIVGPDRAHAVSHPRQNAMAALRKFGLSYPEIGRAFGNRHHTTAMHAEQQANDLRPDAVSNIYYLAKMIRTEGITQ